MQEGINQIIDRIDEIEKTLENKAYLLVKERRESLMKEHAKLLRELDDLCGKETQRILSEAEIRVKKRIDEIEYYLKSCNYSKKAPSYDIVCKERSELIERLQRIRFMKEDKKPEPITNLGDTEKMTPDETTEMMEEKLNKFKQSHSTRSHISLLHIREKDFEENLFMKFELKFPIHESGEDKLAKLQEEIDAFLSKPLGIEIVAVGPSHCRPALLLDMYYPVRLCQLEKGKSYVFSVWKNCPSKFGLKLEYERPVLELFKLVSANAVALEFPKGARFSSEFAFLVTNELQWIAGGACWTGEMPSGNDNHRNLGISFPADRDYAVIADNHRACRFYPGETCVFEINDRTVLNFYKETEVLK